MDKVKRHSRKRDAILACIRSTKTHPDAEWVYRQLKDEFPDLSLGTVYRNINEFKESGEIVSLGTVRGIERIDGDVRPHAHLVCRSCGTVQDADIPVVIPEDHMNGFKSEGFSLMIHGVCEQCLKAHGA